MDRNFSCFFTGHRMIEKSSRAAMTERVKSIIERLVEDKGVTDFITGGAYGFDAMCAQAVIEMREIYPFIRLHLYLPCLNQMSKWSSALQYEGRMIMSKADSKMYVTEGNYVTGCLQLRNKKMADDALYCVAYCRRQKSGTAFTLNYAKEKNCIIEEI